MKIKDIKSHEFHFLLKSFRLIFKKEMARNRMAAIRGRVIFLLFSRRLLLKVEYEPFVQFAVSEWELKVSPCLRVAK